MTFNLAAFLLSACFCTGAIVVLALLRDESPDEPGFTVRVIVFGCIAFCATLLVWGSILAIHSVIKLW